LVDANSSLPNLDGPRRGTCDLVTAIRAVTKPQVFDLPVLGIAGLIELGVGSTQSDSGGVPIDYCAHTGFLRVRRGIAASIPDEWTEIACIDRRLTLGSKR
jgi:hypothetical protein